MINRRQDAQRRRHANRRARDRRLLENALKSIEQSEKRSKVARYTGRTVRAMVGGNLVTIEVRTVSEGTVCVMLSGIRMSMTHDQFLDSLFDPQRHLFRG